jgi:hypothetical protein
VSGTDGVSAPLEWSGDIVGSVQFKRLIPAFACTVGVLTLTHIPLDCVPEEIAIGGLDKVIHAAAYGAIMLSFLSAMEVRPRWWLLLVFVLAVMMVGAADELTQPLVNRHCSFWDFIADLTGIGIGCLIAPRARLSA